MTAVLAASAALLLTPISVAPAAADTSCNGTQITWTGNGDGRAWSDASNWSPEQVPGKDDLVTIPSTGNEVFIDNPDSVCDLTITGSPPDGTVFFHAGSGITVSDDLSITAPVVWDGSITVQGTTTLSGSLQFATNGNVVFPATSVLDTQDLVVEPNTDIDLSDGTTNIRVEGNATLPTTHIWSNGSSASDNIAQFQLAPGATAELTGDVDAELDVELGAGSDLDLGGHTLDVHSHSYSWWSGATVSSSAPGGLVKFEDGTWCLLDQTDTLASNVTLQMLDDSRLSDSADYGGQATMPAGHAGALTGGGLLDFVAGHMVGNLTLDPGFATRFDGGGYRRVEQVDGTVLKNLGTITVVDGQLDIPDDPGQIVNGGKFVIDTGVTVTGGGGPGGDLVNQAAGTIQIHPVSGSTAATLEAGLLNAGTLSVPAGSVLDLSDSRYHQLANGSVLTGGGTLDVIDQTSLMLTGTSTVTGGSTLALDGYHSFLLAGQPPAGSTGWQPAQLTTPKQQHGAFQFRQGELDGHLSLTGALAVAFHRSSNDSDVQIGGQTDYDQTQITLSSPAVVDSTPVSIANSSAVYVRSNLRLIGSDPALGTGYGYQGATITVFPGAAVSVPSASHAVHATMDYPITNQGSIDIARGNTLAMPSGLVQKAGLLRGTCTVSDLTVNGGTVRPSADSKHVGTITVTHDYVQGKHATLVELVAGKGGSQHDALTAGYSAKLAGTVAPVRTAHYRPRVGSKFVAVSADSVRAGKFTKVKSAGLKRHQHWKQIASGTAVTLKLV